MCLCIFFCKYNQPVCGFQIGVHNWEDGANNLSRKTVCSAPANRGHVGICWLDVNFLFLVRSSDGDYYWVNDVTLQEYKLNVNKYVLVEDGRFPT